MAHLIDDENNPAQQLLKAIAADPLTWRRRLGITDNTAELRQRITELRRKLTLLEQMSPPPRVPTPPPAPRYAAMNGHTPHRSTKP